MATAQSKLQIIIDVITGNSAQNVSSLESSILKLGVGIAAGVVAFKAFSEAAKKAFEFAKAGADLELIETRFNKLAESIGTTGDALMDGLGPAMGNMASDAEMMATALDLMGLGLVKTQEEALRLATVAGQLGMNMNQLVLTLTNQTTMRFDALGVSVDGFAEKVEGLEDAGMSASDAFQEAFLQQAEQQLDLVGSAADTTAGEFAKLEAHIKNMGDAAKKAAAEGVVPLVAAINDMFEGSAPEIALQLEYAMENFLISAAEAAGITRDLIYEIITEEEAIEQLNIIIKQNMTDVIGADAAMLQWAKNMGLVVDEADALVNALNKAFSGDGMFPGEKNFELTKDGFVSVAEAAEIAAKTTQQFADSQVTLLDGMLQYADLFQSNMYDLSAGIDVAMLDTLIQKAHEAAAAGGDWEFYVEGIRAIDPAMAEAMEASTEFIAFQETLYEAVADGTITWDEAAAAADNVSSAVKNVGSAYDVAMAAIWDLSVSEKDATEIQNEYNDAVEEGAVPINALASAMKAAGVPADQVQEALGFMVENLTDAVPAAEAMTEELQDLGLAADGVGDIEIPIPKDLTQFGEETTAISDDLLGLESDIDTTKSDEALTATQEGIGNNIIDLEKFAGTIDDLITNSPYRIEIITTYTSVGQPPSTGGGGGGTTTSTPGVKDQGSGDPTAGGGNVLAGSRYLVGEQGPELFIPYAHGEIIPNNDIGTVGGRTLNVYQTNQVTNTNPLTAAMNQAFIDSSLTAEFRGQL